MQRRAFCRAIAATLLFIAKGARASTYPDRSIRLIVPFTVGGTTDVVARIAAAAIGKTLGRTVIVDNRGGASGSIGTMELVRANPDGYTLELVTPSITASNPAINPNIPYDPITDLTPIVNVVASPTVLVVGPNFPTQEYEKFVAEVQAKPGQYTYASSGAGGILNLQMEIFKNEAGLSINHIPYRGAGPAVNDVVGGQVSMTYESVPSILPLIKSGKLRPVVVLAPSRLKELPNVPTFSQVGIHDLARMQHFGIVGPRGLPLEMTQCINQATLTALRDPAVRQHFEDLGLQIVGSSPDEFAQEIRQLYAQMKRIVKEKNLKLE